MKLITRDIISPLVRLEEDGIIYEYDDVIRLLNKWHAVFNHLDLNDGDGYISAGALTLEYVTLLIAGAERGLVYNSPHADELTDRVANQNRDSIKAIILPTHDPRANFIHVSDENRRFYTEEVHYFKPATPVFGHITEDSIILRGHTSGTTGPAKPYTHTHKSFHTTIFYCASRFFTSRDVFSSIGDVNHTALIACISIPVLVAGCHVIYSKGLRRGLFQTNASKTPNKVAVPQIHLLDFLQREPVWEDYRFDHIDEFFTGGTVLSRISMVESLLKDKGVKKLTCVYGSSETGTVSALELDKDTMDQKFSSDDYPMIGEFFPHVEVKLNENNHLLIKTDSLASNIPLDEDGFFNPGDQIVIENDQWYISGRRDRSVKIQDTIISLSMIDYQLTEFRINDELVIEKAYCFTRDGFLLAAIKPINAQLGQLITIDGLREHIERSMSYFVTLNGFVLADQVIHPSGVKTIWKTDDLTIPEENAVWDNPLAFKRKDIVNMFSQPSPRTPMHIENLTRLRRGTKIKS